MKNYDVMVREFRELPSVVRVALIERLTNQKPIASSMRGWIELLPRHEDNVLLASVVFEHGVPISWAGALHHHDFPRDVFHLGVYTDPECRLKGFGKLALSALVVGPLRGMRCGYSVIPPGAKEFYESFSERPGFYVGHF